MDHGHQRKQTNRHICIYIYIYIYIHVHTYIYIYIYIFLGESNLVSQLPVSASDWKNDHKSVDVGQNTISHLQTDDLIL